MDKKQSVYEKIKETLAVAVAKYVALAAAIGVVVSFAVSRALQQAGKSQKRQPISLRIYSPGAKCCNRGCINR